MYVDHPWCSTMCVGQDGREENSTLQLLGGMILQYCFVLSTSEYNRKVDKTLRSIVEKRERMLHSAVKLRIRGAFLIPPIQQQG